MTCCLCIGLGLLLIYFCISVFFLLFPMFHKKKKLNKAIQKTLNSKPFLILGHRGGLSEHPENTMQGIEYAIKNNISIELDLQKTKDDKFILCHDAYLHRITGQHNYVNELNYDQIQPVLDYIHNSYNDKKTNVVNDKKLKPALFLDVLKAVQSYDDILISIDVKTKKEEDLIEVIQILKKMKMEHRVFMGSFKHFDFDLLKKKHNITNVAFFGGQQQCKKVIYGFILGLLPFIDTDCDIFFLPYYFESIPYQTDFPNFQSKLLFKIWKGFLECTFKYFVRHLQGRNIPVCFWTINTENDVEKCMKFGTNGIICDNPSILKEYVSFKELE